jgi:hypothetical protein
MKKGVAKAIRAVVGQGREILDAASPQERRILAPPSTAYRCPVRRRGARREWGVQVKAEFWSRCEAHESPGSPPTMFGPAGSGMSQTRPPRGTEPASLLRIGALKASMIPPRRQRELRELVRYRQSLVRERGPKPAGSQRSGKARTSSWPASSATFWRSPGRGSCRPWRPGKPTPRRWPASPTRGFEPRTRP